MRRVDIKKEVLEELYWEQGMSLRDIGSKLGCSMQTVSRRMQEYKIPTRSSKDGRNTAYHKKKMEGYHKSLEKREVRKCPFCNTDFEVKPSSKQKYCTLACYHKERSALAVTKTVCDYCGKEYGRPNNYPKSEKQFCSTTCAGNWKSDNLTGKNSPTWSRVETKCGFCDTVIHVKKSEYRENGFNYCDKDCMGKHYSITLRGENNPHWQGGKVGYYGPNWLEARRQTRKRDEYQCQRCGIHEDDLPTELTVHHIKLFRTFDNFEDANSLNNLISLCSKCHSFVHSNKNTEKDFLHTEEKI